MTGKDDVTKSMIRKEEDEVGLTATGVLISTTNTKLLSQHSI